MKVRVRFLAHFKTAFGGKERDAEIAPGAWLMDLLDGLCDTSERRREIFTVEGALNPQVIVMKNGSNILSLQGLETPLEDGDMIAILPFLIGG